MFHAKCVIADCVIHRKLYSMLGKADVILKPESGRRCKKWWVFAQGKCRLAWHSKTWSYLSFSCSSGRGAAAWTRSRSSWSCSGVWLYKDCVEALYKPFFAKGSNGAETLINAEELRASAVAHEETRSGSDDDKLETFAKASCRTLTGA